MKKTIIAAILIAGWASHSFAQTEGEAGKPKEKAVDMYIGVQLNTLIRQIFNNNGNANAATNPYMLVYSLNSRKTGWGARLGAGYTHNSFSNNDGITSTKNNINEMQVRIGGEKLFKLANKWSAGAGLDLLCNSDNDHTINTVNSSVGGFGQTVDTRTTVLTFGGGPQGWLRYHISERVLIGTEASFYYITGNEKRAISVMSGGVVGSNQTDQSNNISRGNFNSPVAFFVFVKI